MHSTNLLTYLLCDQRQAVVQQIELVQAKRAKNLSVYMCYSVAKRAYRFPLYLTMSLYVWFFEVANICVYSLYAGRPSSYQSSIQQNRVSVFS